MNFTYNFLPLWKWATKEMTAQLVKNGLPFPMRQENKLKKCIYN